MQITASTLVPAATTSDPILRTALGTSSLQNFCTFTPGFDYIMYYCWIWIPRTQCALREKNTNDRIKIEDDIMQKKKQQLAW